MADYGYYTYDSYDSYTSGPNFEYLWNAPGIPLNSASLGAPVTKNGSHYDVGNYDLQIPKYNTVDRTPPNATLAVKNESFGNVEDGQKIRAVTTKSSDMQSLQSFFTDSRTILFIILFAFLWIIMNRLDYVTDKLLKIKKKLKGVKHELSHDEK